MDQMRALQTGLQFKRQVRGRNGLYTTSMHTVHVDTPFISFPRLRTHTLVSHRPDSNRRSVLVSLKLTPLHSLIQNLRSLPVCVYDAAYTSPPHTFNRAHLTVVYPLTSTNHLNLFFPRLLLPSCLPLFLPSSSLASSSLPHHYTDRSINLQAASLSQGLYD